MIYSFNLKGQYRNVFLYDGMAGKHSHSGESKLDRENFKFSQIIAYVEIGV